MDSTSHPSKCQAGGVSRPSSALWPILGYLFFLAFVGAVVWGALTCR